MERTGSIDKYFSQIAEDWKAYQQKETSLEAQTFQGGLGTTLKLLKSIGAGKSPQIILLIEKGTLQQELATYANSAEMVNSIRPALGEIEAASGALQHVQDKDAYAKAAETYAPKRKQGGLPLDAFREFILSHTARLTNRLKSSASVPEKNILRQRKDNLKAANERYMKMQRAALGMDKAQDMRLGL